MIRWLGTAVGFAVVSLSALGSGPKGFEDPVLLDKVMKGNIVVEHALDTPTEFRSYVRAFFNKVSPDAFTDLYTSHREWIGLIPEIKDAKTKSVSADKTVYEWWLHMKVKYAIFTFDVYPEGRQTVTRAPDAVSEWKIHNLITNYQEDIKVGEETVRLIPHQGGILVENEIHVEIHKANSQSSTVKKELQKKFTALVAAFREKLGGDY